MFAGIKSYHKVHTLGMKKHLAQSLGHKLGRLGGVSMTGMNASNHNTEHGEGVNNMIYNKSNLAEAVYYLFGKKKLHSVVLAIPRLTVFVYEAYFPHMVLVASYLFSPYGLM